MQHASALKTSANLNSWRAWDAKAYERSGFTALLGGVFALMLAFVLGSSLFGRLLGEDWVRMSFIGLVLFLGAAFTLMALAVSRLKAWKRANPWTPPS